jgi:hypothetical protein
MLKKAFAGNDIQFTLPTVTVAGGSEGAQAAAARQAIVLAQQPAAE